VWKTEHKVEADAEPEVIWAMWSDVSRWPEWNADLERAEILTIHRIDRLGGERIRIVYGMEITGPEADTVGPQLGPEISADFPEVLASLVERAHSR
jgi:hypothetical protein